MEKSHWILQKATVSFPLRISITGGRDFKSATNDNEANKPNICITSMYLLPNIPSQNSAASLNFKAFSNELHPVRVEIKTNKKNFYDLSKNNLSGFGDQGGLSNLKFKSIL